MADSCELRDGCPAPVFAIISVMFDPPLAVCREHYCDVMHPDHEVGVRCPSEWGRDG
jgi:hypothetical protein